MDKLVLMVHSNKTMLTLKSEILSLCSPLLGKKDMKALVLTVHHPMPDRLVCSLLLCMKRRGNSPDPVSELHGVRDGGAEQNDVDMLWQHDQYFLPHHTALHDTNICKKSRVKSGLKSDVNLVVTSGVNVKGKVRAKVRCKLGGNVRSKLTSESLI